MLSNLMVLGRKEDFSSFLQESNKKPLLVKFSTSWCPPCRELNKVIKEFLVKENEITVLEVDAEKFSSLAQDSQFNVRSVPSLFLIYQGKIIKKTQGCMDLEQLKKFTKI